MADNLLSINKSIKRNYAIDVLKVFLTFEVVLIHFWDLDDAHGLLRMFKAFESCAVPAFMVISFFLTSKYIINANTEKIRGRIIRLVIPFLFWGLFNWIVMICAELVLRIDLIDGIRVLVLQLLMGNGFHVNAPLWYIAVLIWITILYFMIFKFCSKRCAFIVIGVFSIICLIQQYFGVFFVMFSNFSFELKYPLGRFFEMIPHATVGLLIGYVLHNYRFKHKGSVFCISLLVSITWVYTYDLIKRPNGFGYSGLSLMIVSSALFFVALCFPWIPQENGIVLKIVRIITKHTLGIYCTHYLIGNILDIGLNKYSVSLDRFILCIAIYLIGYIFCLALSMFHVKWLNQLID